MKVSRTSSRLTVLAMLTLGVVAAEGKMRQASLVEKTRQSELIVIGAISELRAKNTVVQIGSVLKGSPSGKSIEFELDGTENLVMPAAHFSPGDAILVFANKKGSRYVPVMGGQGVLKLEGAWSAQYESAIKRILEYDSAASNQKRALLLAMLRSSNRLLQHAALWDFLFLDRGIHRRGAENDDLLPALEGLAKGADDSIARLATQVIAKMDSPKSVPILIDLVGSGNAGSSDVASRTLSRKIRREKVDAPPKTPAERIKAMREWKGWWEKNKNKHK